jgi:hypothetical protein
MEKRVPARLTPAAGRKFGLTVGLAFGVIGALAWWRGHALPSAVTLTISSALVGAALVIPTRLGPVERAWMALALAISRVTTPLFMGVVYFLIITPVGWMRNLRGRGPLTTRTDGTVWVEHTPANPQQMERQF